MSKRNRAKRRQRPTPGAGPRSDCREESPSTVQNTSGLNAVKELASLPLETEGDELDRAARKIGLAQISRLLGGLDEHALREQIEGDLRHYVGLLNALARLSRSGVDPRQRQGKSGEGSPEPDGSKGLRPETLENIERQLRLL